MIFGKRPSEYFAFAKPVLILIFVVAVARLVLSLVGVPPSAARWVSVTAAGWLGVLYFAIRVPTSGFGSYKQLLPLCALGSWTAQLVIVPSIILAIVTQKDNIYSLPEFAFGSDGKTWVHAAAHLLVGTTVAPLLAWGIGCLVMLITKKFGPKDTASATARA